MYFSCCPGKPHEPGEPHCQLLSTTTLGEFRVHFGGRAASAFAATAPSPTETTSAASATTTAARRASARFVTSTDLLARARPRTPTWLRGNGEAESTLGPVRGGSPRERQARPVRSARHCTTRQSTSPRRRHPCDGSSATPGRRSDRGPT